jgi:probable HAF family extracellular repeat protein
MSADRGSESYGQKGAMVDLGSLGGSSSLAYAVNGSGQVVGYSYTAGDAASHTVMWQVAKG